MTATDNAPLAHPAAHAHLEVLARRFYPVGQYAWCLVGNGLSNQSFVIGPEGIIAIDSGECVEEMRAALAELRRVTDKPVVACIYTHFHYVNGTQALLDEGHPVAIYGHHGIADNLNRFAGEIAPRANRGLVRQFGTALPNQGSDALLHCGLGLSYRNPEHAPYTPGYVAATHLIDGATTLTIAGLEVRVVPAPSDATDSLTLYFPAFDLCVNNLVWPALFNIFAIRGEAFRDPRVVLEGLDHILSLQPGALIGTHGPPVTQDVTRVVTDYRDAIQFIWDQTVRLINKGLTLNETAAAVVLPEYFQRTYFTRQLYGLVEHHVRQIHAGVFGWLDEEESHLFPLPTQARHARLIAGFGGRRKVRRACREALAQDDWRWALELGTWLARSTRAVQQDRELLAEALRRVAYTTTAANVRNWALTTALELQGRVDLSRFRVQRFSERQILAMTPAQSVALLRVMLDPDRARSVADVKVAWHFVADVSCALRIRHQVAVVSDATNAEIRLGLSLETWARVLSGAANFWVMEQDGLLSIDGDYKQLAEILSCFEHPALQTP